MVTFSCLSIPLCHLLRKSGYGKVMLIFHKKITQRGAVYNNKFAVNYITFIYKKIEICLGKFRHESTLFSRYIFCLSDNINTKTCSNYLKGWLH